MDITLSYAELMIAGTVGMMRRVGSMKRNMDTDRHAPHSSWATDIDGAAAEMAVARAKGVYWTGHTNNFIGDDVLGGIQVRSTIKDDGCLIVRATDKDTALFVLVIAKPPIYSIRGQIVAKDAKQEKHFRRGGNSGSDAWWVPQCDLQPFGLEEVSGEKA